MRISDWSSDVCSSDLVQNRQRQIPTRLMVSSRLRESVARWCSSTTRTSPITSSRDRSEERRVGQECVSTCRSRSSPHPQQQNTPPTPTPPTQHPHPHTPPPPPPTPTTTPPTQPPPPPTHPPPPHP